MDIKRTAEQHIEFYRMQVDAKSTEGKFLQGDREIAKRVSSLVDYLSQYQAALYLLGFSTFLDVVFSESFDSQYLRGIAEKFEQYGIEYRQLYTDAYNRIDQASRSSIEGLLLGGVAGASGFLGRALSKVPVLEKGPVDEMLQDAGSSLSNLNGVRLAKALDQLVLRRDNSILPFAENIKLIDRLHNGKATYYLDGDTLYCDAGHSEEIPNAETLEAFREAEYATAHPDEFQSFSSGKDLLDDVLRS